MAALGPSPQECDDALLVAPVADRLHVVSTFDDERLGARNERGELFRRTANDILAADRHQHRARQRRQSLRPYRITRAADTGRQCLEITAGLLGECAERPGCLAGDVVDRRRFERVRTRMW